MVICLLVSCSLPQCTTQKKITYNLPSELSEANQKKILDLCEKGKVLFKANCAGCHGVFTNGVQGITNFSVTQIDNYTAKFLQGDPKNHAVMKNMSSQQMANILLFLKYKKTTIPDTVKAKK